jgi:hypothetical protein
VTARAVLRIRRSVEGLPPPTSDEDLIAWSQSLVQSAHRRREPLRAPSRGSALTDDEIFDEIRARVARPRR